MTQNWSLLTAGPEREGAANFEPYWRRLSMQAAPYDEPPVQDGQVQERHLRLQRDHRPRLPRPAASRAPSQLAHRDALSLTVSARRLSDLLSNSRRGDAADWQVACGSMLWQRRFVSSLELRRARPADGDTTAVCGPRALAMRPRRVAVGYCLRERCANDDRDGCSTVYYHSGCGCESGSAGP